MHHNPLTNFVWGKASVNAYYSLTKFVWAKASVNASDQYMGKLDSKRHREMNHRMNPKMGL